MRRCCCSSAENPGGEARGEEAQGGGEEETQGGGEEETQRGGEEKAQGGREAEEDSRKGNQVQGLSWFMFL